VFAAALTYLVPVGQFDTHEVTYTDQFDNQRTRDVLIPESFRLLRDEDGTPMRRGVPVFAPSDRIGLLNYVFEGLASGNKYGSAVGVVMFILVIGGAFGIVLRTGAVEAGIMATIKRTAGAEFLLIPVMYALFSLGGAVFGMGEEAIAFAMILVPLCIAMGYDAVTGVLITYVATQIGFATSWMNPFSVAIAQGIAGVPVLSGAPFRIGMWVFFTLLGTAFAMVYAARVKPSRVSGRCEFAGALLHRAQARAADHTGDHRLGHLGRGLAPVLHTGARLAVLRHGPRRRGHRCGIQVE
jgi:uncharacterized ion transporter superfamily protein YfcC